jgi:hypothetical protein
LWIVCGPGFQFFSDFSDEEEDDEEEAPAQGKRKAGKDQGPAAKKAKGECMLTFVW